MMKYFPKVLVMVVAGVILGGFFVLWHPAHAKADFVANDVMDDDIFNNVSSMSASQIDAFINNNFPNSCISTNNGFSSVDVTGYSPTGPSISDGFYYGSPVSAGTVIYDAAQAFGLNPQVLIATLEKEENLVSGSAGCSTWRYASALGFSCTDSPNNGPSYSYTNGSDAGTLPTPLFYINGAPVNSVPSSCVSDASMAGFSEQVIWAAWLLERGLQRSEGNVNWAVIKGNWNNSDDPTECYGGPMTQGYRSRIAQQYATQNCPYSLIYYDGYTTIDGQSVHMDTGATASLYWYTPHFHGNESFDGIFEGWFGPVKGSLVQAYGDKTVYLLSGTTAYPIYDVNVLNDLYPLGPVRQTSAAEINNYSLGAVAAHLYKDSDGTVYLVNSGIKLVFPDCGLVADYGYSCGNALALTDSQLAKFSNGPPATHLLKGVSSPNVYYIESGQKRQVPTWYDVQAFKIANVNVLSDSYVSSLPTSPALAYGPGSLVKTPNNPSVYVVKDSDNIYPLSDFLYTQELGLGANVRTIASYYSVLENSLFTKVQCGGNYYIGTQGTAYAVSSSMMTAYGFNSSTFLDGGSACLNLPISSQPLGQFIRTATGAIFYVSGGQKRYITTYAVYQAHGGNATNTIPVSNYFLNMIPDGPPLSS